MHKSFLWFSHFNINFDKNIYACGVEYQKHKPGLKA